MFRILALIALTPTIAHADWSPHPLMFTYEATLDTCLLDPDAPDLAAFCADAINAAYVLKRAVAWAAFECGTADLSTCVLPFEDEGLPAIAVRIAVDVGCDATDVALLPEGAPLHRDHCIAVASDIMIDEGVVPLITDIACGIDWVECGELAHINAAFWANQVDLAASDDPIITDLQVRNKLECGEIARQIDGWGRDLDLQTCLSERSAALWADLSQTEQDQ